MAIEGFCVVCREKVEMKKPVKVIMANGRKATSGTCPTCKTKVFRIG